LGKKRILQLNCKVKWAITGRAEQQIQISWDEVSSRIRFENYPSFQAQVTCVYGSQTTKDMAYQPAESRCCGAETCSVEEE